MLSFVRKMKELLQLPRPKPSVGSVVLGKVSSSVSKHMVLCLVYMLCTCA
ncbi:hypothetical protein HanOQP8_Chr01g0028431 [Helianthus annuus]|nr:hypothetical protein HanOQP8_Chr01g0028431 [Helianthus annuus]